MGCAALVRKAQRCTGLARFAAVRRRSARDRERGLGSVSAMSDDAPSDNLRDRLGRQSEEALARLAQDLLENPLVSGTISRAFEARERAAQAQEAAMGALNLPSAADLERLTRRVRSVSQRLEGIEDAVDRLDDRLAGQARAAGGDDRLAGLEARLASVEAALNDIAASLADLRAARPAAGRSTRASAAKRPAAKPRSTPD
jgi:DNA repair exonuclease SbcCD ATPase subunit